MMPLRQPDSSKDTVGTERLSFRILALEFQRLHLKQERRKQNNFRSLTFLASSKIALSLASMATESTRKIFPAALNYSLPLKNFETKS